jgi:hypothetical protein
MTEEEKDNKITEEEKDELFKKLQREIAQSISDMEQGIYFTHEDLVKRYGLDLVEEAEDIQAADEAHKEWVAGGKKIISHEEMMDRYG